MNPITTHLGIQHPIIQAPMAGAQTADLTIAACQAGVLGSLPCALLSPETIEAEVARIRQATNRPFALNFFAHQTQAQSAESLTRWYTLLAPYFEKYHIDPKQLSASGGRQPFSAEQAELLESLKPPIVSFHFGLPSPALLARVRATGATILSSATSVREAIWLAERGCDIIIAQGAEAGGHRGMFLETDPLTQTGLFSLLPRIRDALPEQLLIAAGGISDYRTAQAARILGADGVQVGTALLTSTHSSISENHRNALAKNSADNTALTNLFSGGYARGIVTPFMQENGCLNPNVPAFPYAGNAIAALKNASAEFAPQWAGQNAVLAKGGTVEDILKPIIEGFACVSRA